MQGDRVTKLADGTRRAYEVGWGGGDGDSIPGFNL